MWIAIALLVWSFVTAPLVGAVLGMRRRAEEVDVALVAAHLRINELEAARVRDLARVREIAVGLEQFSKLVGWLARQHGAIVVQTDAKARLN